MSSEAPATNEPKEERHNLRDLAFVLIAALVSGLLAAFVAAHATYAEISSENQRSLLEATRQDYANMVTGVFDAQSITSNKQLLTEAPRIDREVNASLAKVMVLAKTQSLRDAASELTEAVSKYLGDLYLVFPDGAEEPEPYEVAKKHQVALNEAADDFADLARAELE